MERQGESITEVGNRWRNDAVNGKRVEGRASLESTMELLRYTEEFVLGNRFSEPTAPPATEKRHAVVGSEPKKNNQTSANRPAKLDESIEFKTKTEALESKPIPPPVE
jgi:hypothetical protein